MKLFSKTTEVLVSVALIVLTIGLMALVLVAGHKLESKPPMVTAVAHDTTTYNLKLHGRHKVLEGITCINIDNKFNETAILKVDNVTNDIELHTNGKVIKYANCSKSVRNSTAGMAGKTITYNCTVNNKHVCISVLLYKTPGEYDKRSIFIKSKKMFTSYYIQ